MNETDATAKPQDNAEPNRLDPAFFACVNEYLELANRHAGQHGLKRTSVAVLYAAARFNVHVYLAHMLPGEMAGERKEFLDYMSDLYRRMLNEHLDVLGQERGLDVGPSELSAAPAAAGEAPPAAQGTPAQ